MRAFIYSGHIQQQQPTDTLRCIPACHPAAATASASHLLGATAQQPHNAQVAEASQPVHAARKGRRVLRAAAVAQQKSKAEAVWGDGLCVRQGEKGGRRGTCCCWQLRLQGGKRPRPPAASSVLPFCRPSAHTSTRSRRPSTRMRLNNRLSCPLPPAHATPRTPRGRGTCTAGLLACSTRRAVTRRPIGLPAVLRLPSPQARVWAR